MIPKTFIAKIEEKTNLGELIGNYVKLEPQGNDLVGICPFHSGNKSLFKVSPEKMIWKCFKCGKGGNSISFIMEIEKLPFPEAVRFLANKLKLKVPEV